MVIADQYVKCNICGEDNTSFVTDELRFGHRRPIVKCKCCGLIYMNPQRSKEEDERFYRFEYRNLFSHSESSGDRFRQRLPMAEDRFRRIQHLLDPQMKILEVGSAAGSFLYVLKRHGYQGVGVELDENYVKFSREDLGLEIYNQPAETLSIRDETFDCIVMWHVLEHMADPAYFIKSVAYRLLKPNGTLLIEVPNANNFLVGVLKHPQAIHHFYQPAHTYYFTPNTLTLLLEKNGFTANVKPIETAGLSGLLSLNQPMSNPLLCSLRHTLTLVWYKLRLEFILRRMLMSTGKSNVLFAIGTK